MKATGIVRRFDDLGRISIPKEIRRQLFNECTDGKPMEIFVDGDSIVLKKYEDAEMRKEQEIRNKAIDEFVKEIKDWQIDIQDNEYDADKFDFVFERIFEIAEELKEVRNE